MSMKQILEHLIHKQQGYVELRWHKRVSNSFLATKGRVDVANHSVTEGVGVRALVGGAWGFAATSDVSEAAILRAIEQAKANASLLAKARGGAHKIEMRPGKLCVKDFTGEGFAELRDMPIADKLGKVIELEHQLAKASSRMHTARARYTEYLEEKAIVTSDGAHCSFQIAQPELSLSAIAEKTAKDPRVAKVPALAAVGTVCSAIPRWITSWRTSPRQQSICSMQSTQKADAKKSF